MTNPAIRTAVDHLKGGREALYRALDGTVNPHDYQEIIDSLQDTHNTILRLGVRFGNARR